MYLRHGKLTSCYLVLQITKIEAQNQTCLLIIWGNLTLEVLQSYLSIKTYTNLRNEAKNPQKEYQITNQAKNNFYNMHINAYQRLQTTFEIKRRIYKKIVLVKEVRTLLLLLLLLL